MVDVADRDEAVDERGESVSFADENVSSRDLKRALGNVSSSSEVVEHLLQTAVGSGDAILAGDGPRDARSEQLLEGGASPARVELVLRRVQPTEQVDGGVPVHGACAGVRSPAGARQARPISRIIGGYTIRCRKGAIAAM